MPHALVPEIRSSLNLWTTAVSDPANWRDCPCGRWVCQGRQHSECNFAGQVHKSLNSVPSCVWLG